MVMPHFDDIIPFMDTRQHRFRGGIWADQEATSGPTEHTKIPDEALEDDAELEAEAVPVPYALSGAKDGRSLSMPMSLGTLASDLISKAAAGSKQGFDETVKNSIATGIENGPEPPKALRSRSFASAANPLLSMDIAYRSRPTSPTETPSGAAPRPPSLWENSRKSSSASSTFSNPNGTAEQNPPQDAVSSSASQTSLPPTPTSTSSRSRKSTFESDSSQLRVLQADTRTATSQEKRQSVLALGAATAAAKKWGWGVLSRNMEQKDQQVPDPDRAGTPKHPIGRGRPLPPPGQPLPLPEGTRAKTMPATTPKRKPVPKPNVPQKRQDETKARTIPPPPLPARKGGRSAHIDHDSEGGLLIVEAPPVSEPSSPSDDKRDEHLSNLGIEPVIDQKEPAASIPDDIALDAGKS